MSQNERSAALAYAGPASGQSEAAAVKSRKHRVVLESVTQEKKKLRSVVS